MKNKHLNYLVLLVGLGFVGCSEGSTGLLPIEFDDQECEADEIICQKKAVYICENGQWVVEEECLKGCDDNGFECAAGKSQINDKNDKNDDGSCDDGKVKCDNGVLKTCEDGEWSEKTCSNGCNDEGTGCKSSETDPVVEPGGDSKICEDGTVICEDDTLKTCSQNTWVTETCELGCDEAANTCKKPDAPECQSDEAKCTEEGSFICEDAHWVFKTACENGCYETACATCKAGDSQCTDNHEKRCQDNQWVEKDCDYYCNSEGTACAEIDQNQPTRYLMKTLHSPLTPYVVAQMKAIAAKNSSKNNSVFIKVGDSHYDYDFDGCFMKCFSTATSSAVTLDGRDELQNVITTFQSVKDSFNRDSLAAVGGSSTRNGLSGSPNLIAQEISAMQPRFAFYGHGSNDLGNGAYIYEPIANVASGYPWAMEDYYRKANAALDQMIDEGVIPLISGITPNDRSETYINYLKTVETNPADYPRFVIQTFNAISRGIAEYRQLPWFDTYHAYMPLAGHGLRDSDHIHGSTSGSPCNFTAEGLQYGVNQRNLGSIEMLNAAWQAVVNSVEATDILEEPFQGAGSQEDPYIITSLPYTHSGNTSDSPNKKIDVYGGGCGNVTEYGAEYYYKLELPEKARLKMFVVSANNVDADIQVLKGNMSGDACVTRSNIFLQGYLDAGTYYIVADTYGKSASDPKPGQYLLGILECDADDPRCDVAMHGY